MRTPGKIEAMEALPPRAGHGPRPMRWLSLVLGFLVISPAAHASLATTLAVKCELELSGGQRVSGFVEWGADAGCKDPELTDAKFLKSVRTLWDESSPKTLTVYTSVYPLRYRPKSPGKVGGHILEARVSFLGFLGSEARELDRRSIVKAHIRECVESSGVAPILVLNKKEIDLLRKPAEAWFSEECYPAGNVSLISYNKKWDTAAKLGSLLKEFVKTVGTGRNYCEDPGPDAFWSPIFIDGAESKFKRAYDAQNVLLLIYHVQD